MRIYIHISCVRVGQQPAVVIAQQKLNNARTAGETESERGTWPVDAGAGGKKRTASHIQEGGCPPDT